jgi:hypothetical protein
MSSYSSDWAKTIAKKWKYRRIPKKAKHDQLLKRAVILLDEVRTNLPRSPLSLPEQPFDLHLLNCSALYKRSRHLYLGQGGRFFPSLVSTPRTLSSPILLDQKIEYSPIESEVIWAATDPIESQNYERLLELRTFSSSLFHEQNHRLLWSLLPYASAKNFGLNRYLNFAESLIIISDMALGDQLGPGLASLFYLTGVTYDPGTSVRQELSTGRNYRNYLQATLHATYLYLELFEPSEIPKVIRALFPLLGRFADRAANRALNLDRAFVHQTNLEWQERHHKILMEKFCVPKKPILELSADPMDNRTQYLFAEKWFDFIGL